MTDDAPRRDHPVAGDEGEPRLVRRCPDDDLATADHRPPRPSPGDLLCRGVAGLPGCDRKPHLGRIRVDDWTVRAGPQHLAQRGRQARASDELTGRTVSAHDRYVSLGAAVVQHPDGSVVADGDVAFAAAELDRKVLDTAVAVAREAVVHLVEEDDGAVGRDVEARGPDSRLLPSVVQSEVARARAPRGREEDRVGRPRRAERVGAQIDGRPLRDDPRTLGCVCAACRNGRAVAAAVLERDVVLEAGPTPERRRDGVREPSVREPGKGDLFERAVADRPYVQRARRRARRRRLLASR